jgi:2-keto-4-pentenoate hydratase
MIEHVRLAEAGAAGIAARLVSARRSAKALARYPGDLPTSLEQGYRVQNAAISSWTDGIAGWKIGLVAPELRAGLGSDRLAGPIFSRNVWAATPGQTLEFPAIRDGFCAVEAEFVFRMAIDAPAGKTAWTDDEAAALVAALHFGVEIAGSPMPMINDLGPPIVASDFGNNAGLILGAPIDDWRGKLSKLSAETYIDDRQVGAGSAMSIPGGPIAGLRFLLAHLSTRGRPLKAGQYVSSGAVTGVHRIVEGQGARLSFPGEGEICCRAVRAVASD